MNGFSVSVCSVIWFYVVVIFPSKIYNFHKLEPKKPKDYLVFSLFSLCVVIAAVCSLTSETALSTDGLPFYILIGILYIQSILDCFSHRTKWNCLAFCVFTIFLLLSVLM